MSFLAPTLLWFFALAPVIALFYFPKLKRQSEPISSTYLWQRTIEDLRVNAPFQRMRRNILLLLQLLFVTLLVLALSRPVMEKSAEAGKHYICMIDTSASMGARDVKPSRLDAARREALRLVGDLTGGDRMMLITFDAAPRVLVPFTKAKSRLREAIKSLAVRQTATDFTRPMELIRALTRDMTDVYLYLLSDGAFDREEMDDMGAVTLHYVKMGKRAANVGITALDARRSLESWDRPQVFVRLGNFSDEPKEVRLELYLDGKLINAKAASIGAGEKKAVVFSDAALTQGLLKVKLTPDDDLETDNEAWLVVREPGKINLLTVTPGNYFLTLALQSDPFVSHVLYSPDEFDAEVASGKLTLGDYDAVLFDRHSPKALPAGNYLFFNALPPLDKFSSGADAEEPIVISWDEAHPVNQAVEYANLFLESAMRLKGPPDSHALLESEAGPLILWWGSPAQRIIVVGFDLLKSRWPLRPSFPVFLANSVRYLTRAGPDGESTRVSTGTPIRFAAEDDRKITVQRPDGSASSVPVSSNIASFNDTFLCGPYVFSADGSEPLTWVANLLDERESRIAPRENIRWEKGTVAAKAKALKENREFWKWLALGALAFLMLEWYIYNRRVYI